MAWDVEATKNFEGWFASLDARSQQKVRKSVELLVELGPALGRPHVDTVNASSFPNMKELRVQVGGSPFRIFFAFDARRVAILLVGGDKTGDDRFYQKMIPIADELFAPYATKPERK